VDEGKGRTVDLVDAGAEREELPTRGLGRIGEEGELDIHGDMVTQERQSTIGDRAPTIPRMPGTVLYDREGHVATITYNRPEALNAINGELRADLNAAWVRFRDDEEAWVAIVTGAGRAFSAGADLRQGGAGDASAASFWEMPPLTSLENGLEIWKPIIAAVNGYCIGFALTLVAACDFVIASDKAEFGFPEVRLGVPTIQGAVRMPKKVGWQNAMELLLLGERVDARRAKEMGLCWKVVPHEELMSAARDLAARLCRSAPLAVRATKEVAARGQDLTLLQAVRFGETMRRVAGSTEDAREGMAANREKRPAEWKGR
jgi:enoyl-CoA hydratase/carnithine racemase